MSDPSPAQKIVNRFSDKWLSYDGVVSVSTEIEDDKEIVVIGIRDESVRRINHLPKNAEIRGIAIKSKVTGNAVLAQN